MHMADALLSPTVGVAMWAVSSLAVGHAVRTVNRTPDERRLPLMGVSGAFLFAAQMITIAIPATGSSGHLAGGVLLAALLGPHAALLVMAVVLAVQALLFADGGLLALGANLFNLGVLPAYCIYPLIYRPMMAVTSIAYRRRVLLAVSLSAVVSLQLGALAVVIETTISGIAGIPLLPFMLLMQPVHLAIGILEAFLTVTILLLLYRMQPALCHAVNSQSEAELHGVYRTLLISALMVAGLCAWCASQRPDGLEWSLAQLAPVTVAEASSSLLHRMSAGLQSSSALLPDYGCGERVDRQVAVSLSGLIGVAVTLLLTIGIGALARRFAHSRGQ